MVLQRNRLLDRVQQELAAFLRLLRMWGVFDPLQEVVAPFFVQLGKGVDVLVLVEIERGGVLFDRGRGRALGIHGDFMGVGHVLNGRIGRHLLLDDGTQFHHRQLEHLQRLAQLGRQDHHLSLLLKKS